LKGLSKLSSEKRVPAWLLELILVERLGIRVRVRLLAWLVVLLEQR
jgi:hypothetical protein